MQTYNNNYFPADMTNLVIIKNNKNKILFISFLIRLFKTIRVYGVECEHARLAVS